MLTNLRKRLAGFVPSSPLKQNLPEASVLIAITNDQQTPSVVLTRRAAHLSSHPGEVAFPGGKRDATDRDLLHTALRESEEEIALDPAAVEVIGRLNTLESRFGLNVTPYVGIIPAQASMSPNLGELDSIFKVPLDFLLSDERESTHRYTGFASRPVYSPVYRYEGYKIWGLTAMMLVDFLNVGLAAGIDLNQEPETGLSASF